MSKSRLEWKVGLFVFIGLVLVGALLIEFSKGLSLFQNTYTLYLRSQNIGGLKTRAGVLISGVQVGTVSEIQLSKDTRTATITLQLLKKYEIYKDARFVIEQAGFLGDQYVSVLPAKNEGGVFKSGDTADAEMPFDLQEFTRSAAGFIARIDETIKKLNDALEQVTRVVLNPTTLTNVSVTVANLRDVSDGARNTVGELHALIATNEPTLSLSTSNLLVFSQRMNDFAAGLQGVVSTNSPEVHVAVKNLESSSESLKSLLSDVQAGKGMAGDLFKNEQLATNLSQIMNNLSVTTSNLNRLGLWGVLWRHKTPAPVKSPEGPKSLAAPKDPYH